ncbi:hypothetical protein K439DRAFT_1642246, partial [Ramaria rubella]
YSKRPSPQLCVVSVAAESHTVTFNNKCPMLKANGQTLSTGGSFTTNGPLTGCTLVETTLQNPTTPRTGSSSDISLIPPYVNGCDGQSADCTNANCPQVFHNPNDTAVQFECQTPNVGHYIFFRSL